MSGDVISVKDLTVKLGGKIVLEEVSFKVDEPSLIIVVGPNGAGKTTLLKTILGLIKPLKGEVKVLGLDPFSDEKMVRGVVSYVPQRDKIAYEVPLKVSEVVLMGIVLRKKPLRQISREDVEQAKRALAHLGLEDKWDSFFNELSGGQQRRVLIARALASNPTILLLDEVFSGLDVESQERLLSILKDLKEGEKTIILVEHEPEPVIDLADKILVLNRRVCAYGDPSSILSEDRLRPVYPHLKIVERDGRCIFILGDRHA